LKESSSAGHRRERGAHPAALNFGDGIAYEVAREQGCRLLFVGHDFTETDLDSAI
jgi:ribonuclease VapC